MTKPAQPWNASLEDSVYALGAAARECQAAYQATVLAKRNVDLDRIRLLDGKVTHRTPSYTTEQEPHLTALSRIGTALLENEFLLRRLYEEAAQAYAHGATWAAQQVLSGQQPARVEFETDGRGAYVFAQFVPVLKLDRYAKTNALEAARRAYERCLVAGFEAEGIASQDYVADHEATEMQQALDVADGLPDAAYAYGVLAESALHFAINTRSSRE
jgi:hypothetical protein